MRPNFLTPHSNVALLHDTVVNEDVCLFEEAQSAAIHETMDNQAETLIFTETLHLTTMDNKLGSVTKFVKITPPKSDNNHEAKQTSY